MPQVADTHALAELDIAVGIDVDPLRRHKVLKRALAEARGRRQGQAGSQLVGGAATKHHIATDDGRAFGVALVFGLQ